MILEVLSRRLLSGSELLVQDATILFDPTCNHDSIMYAPTVKAPNYALVPGSAHALEASKLGSNDHALDYKSISLDFISILKPASIAVPSSKSLLSLLQQLALRAIDCSSCRFRISLKSLHFQFTSDSGLPLEIH